MINAAPVDRFTALHLAAGAGLGALRVPGSWAVAFAVGWEILERPLKTRFPGAFPHPSQDAPPNALLDVSAVLLGYWLALEVL